MATCAITDCEGPVVSRGWCSLHYGRWRRHGDPTVLVRPRVAKYATEGERREAHRKARRAWERRNPESMAAIRAAWEKRNPDVRRQYRRARKKLDPIANRAYVAARRARLRERAVIPFTAQQLRERLAFFGNRCWMCGGPGEVIDHVKPLAKGGAHILCNLRPACGDCNTRKGVTWPFPSSYRGAAGVPTEGQLVTL